MSEIPLITWILAVFWLSVIGLMGIVCYIKIKKAGPVRRRRQFKLIKGEDVE